MYLGNLYNPIEFQGHMSNVKVIFVSGSKFTKLFSPNVGKIVVANVAVFQRYSRSKLTVFQNLVHC